MTNRLNQIDEGYKTDLEKVQKAVETTNQKFDSQIGTTIQARIKEVEKKQALTNIAIKSQNKQLEEMNENVKRLREHVTSM